MELHDRLVIATWIALTWAACGNTLKQRVAGWIVATVAALASFAW